MQPGSDLGVAEAESDQPKYLTFPPGQLAAALTRWSECLVTTKDTSAELEQLRSTFTSERDAIMVELGLRRQEIDEIHRTLSWRVTKPLRSVRRLGSTR